MITDEQKEQAAAQHKALSKLGEILTLHASAYVPMLEVDKEKILNGLVFVGGPRSLELLKEMVRWMGEDDSMTSDESWIYDVIAAGDKVWQTLPEVHRPNTDA